MTSKLEKLLIGEVSGVGDPANEIPGFMVVKSVAGADVDEDATSLLGKIRGLINGSGKEDVEMTKDELTTELDARFETFGTSLVEQLSKSLATPEPEGAKTVEKTDETEPAVEEKTEQLTAEDVTKIVAEALEPYSEVFEKVLDRLAATEKALATRKSLDGQEDGEVESKTPTVSDAIGKVLKGVPIARAA